MYLAEYIDVTPIKVGSIEHVIDVTKDVFSFAGTVLNKITGNPILLFIFAAGLVPIGFKVFKGLKRTAK